MSKQLMNNRNLGIDLLRALSMFFVICLHILGQGGLLEHAVTGSVKYYFLRLLQLLSYCAVDVYGITTGYLMCTKSFRLSRLTKLWLTTVFWSVAVSCGFFIFVPESRSIGEMVSMFLPILRGRYWFFTAYFVTMLVSPVLNAVIRSLSKRQFRLLLAALFVVFGIIPVCSLGNDVMRISGGNHFSWMISLYLIGGYIRMHCPHGGDSRRREYLLGYVLFALCHLAYMVVTQMVGLGNWSSLFLTNVSPLIVGEAVCLFGFFRTAGGGIRANGLCGCVIRFITPGIYAVYIIHVHPKVYWNADLIALLRPWDAWSGIKVLAAMLTAAVGVFAVCVLLDAVRQWLFRVLRIDWAAEKLSDRVEYEVRKLLEEK